MRQVAPHVARLAPRASNLTARSSHLACTDRRGSLNPQALHSALTPDDGDAPELSPETSVGKKWGKKGARQRSNNSLGSVVSDAVAAAPPKTPGPPPSPQLPLPPGVKADLATQMSGSSGMLKGIPPQETPVHSMSKLHQQVALYGALARTKVKMRR